MATNDFRIIRPVEITDAMLGTNNVPESVAATYSGATTYALGATAGLAPVDGAAQLVYESLSSGNVGHPLPVPPATLTAYWRYIASVYPAYSGAVTYAAGDMVSSIGTNTHLLYESLVAGNIGNALSDAAKWLHVGAPKVTTGAPYNSTNRWKMFDQSYGSQTVRAENITFTITPGEIANSIAFLNAQGSSIRVQQAISGYDTTISLVEHTVNSWYDWYYELPSTKDDVLFLDIPPYAASTFTVTITAATGYNAACGVCVFGREKLLGTTLWGMTKEIQDYSRVIENAWGDITLLKGAYSERLNLSVKIAPGSEGEVVRQMKAHRAEPLVFVGSTQFDLSIVYGFLGAWSVPCQLSGGIMPVQIKGLT